MSETRLDVAVLGVGKMGRHHARIYSRIPQARLVAVVDADLDRALTVADEYGCKAYATAEDMLREQPQIKAVSVAVPTVAHVRVAEPLIRKGIACLVEKPLAPTAAGAIALTELARDLGVVLQVGHTERFNPVVRAVAAMRIPARFMDVHRVSPMTFRSLDVGVVMDLMIHDLDIVLTLAESPLVKVDATGVAVFGKHEDIANARLEFASGCVANLTASRLGLQTQRRLRLFSEDAYVSLDYQKRNGVVIRKSENQEQIDTLRAAISEGRDLTDVDYAKLLRMEELKMDLPKAEEDPLTAELSSFIRSVLGQSAPVVDGEAGSAAVDAAERVVAAIRAHRWEGLAKASLP